MPSKRFTSSCGAGRARRQPLRSSICSPHGKGSDSVARQLSLGSETLLAIAGVDEAGRGPLAGPVVAAAVILDDERPILELADSKRLTPKQRSRVARAVRTEARAFAVALAEPAEIDSINVLEASLLAMSRAIAKLSIVPGLVRVDGTHT
ncbi:MAG: ribonuclease HII, partial [Gammaproteobacteria bacterium]|nr:ribonuclease HII [Gammaproteobacteria bacterium]